MRTPRPRWPRLPRRTARLRLTVLYGAAFLACGTAVLALTYLIFGNTARPTSSSLPQVLQIRSVNAALKVPVAAVRQAGRYDVITVPVAFAEQVKKAATLPAAQQAKAVAQSEAQIAYTKRLLLIACAIALAVIAVAAAAIGWIIAGRVLRPLSTMTAAARRISASSLHDRLALHGPDDELKELGDTLDSLFARLEASFDAQRRFAASASHELRTPLTRERTLLQVTLADPAATAGTWQAVSRELLASNAETEHLIEALLTLASSEAGPAAREPADLATITSEALAAARPAIGCLGLHVQAGIQPAAFDGDPVLVQQLVTNLIDNAVRHNIPGGDIQITTRTSRAGAVLSVTSSGRVIPPAEVERLFQPFQRLGPRPVRRDGGHGLGLSIVRAIAIAHAAAITAQPRPGGGLAIDVIFPLTAPPETCRPQARRGARVSLPGRGQLRGQPGPRRDEGRAVPGQAAALDQGHPVAGEHLRAVVRAERVRLVRQHDQAGPARDQVIEADLRVSSGVGAVDVVQPEPGGDVAGEGGRSHDHPGVSPDRDGRARPRAGCGVAPHLFRLGQPGRLRPAECDREHPAQRRERLLEGPDHGHPDRDAGRAQALHVEAAVLLLVGQHEVRLERRDGGPVGVLGAPHPGHVQVSGMSAPGGGARQRLGTSGGHRLGQRGHQRHHPADRTVPRHLVPEIVGGHHGLLATNTSSRPGRSGASLTSAGAYPAARRKPSITARGQNRRVESDVSLAPSAAKTYVRR